jgi:signal transduction histidine kinase
MASASATLGVLHLFIWQSRREEYGHLLFFIMTGSIAACAAGELLLMHASTAERYAALLRWIHVPLAGVILSMVGFVYFYFAAGRAWLAVAVCALRLLVLVLNFTTGANINFESVTALDRITQWGGATYAVPVGILNPWWVLAQVNNVLLVAFLADACVSLWMRGEAVARRSALFVAGGMLFCVLGITLVTIGTFAGGLRLPTTITPFYLAVAVAMGYRLGADVLRADQLSRDLRDSERRSELAAHAARLALWSWDTASDEFWMNSIGRNLFGIPQGTVRGIEPLLARVAPEDRGRVDAVMKETVRGGGALEVEFRTAGAPARWIATRAEVERLQAEGALLRGVSIDVSEQRRAERELAQQRDQLAQLSHVAAFGEMAGSIAHEINQPLMAILSNAQAAQRFLAHDTPDLAEVRAAIADIVDDDRRASEVIRRLRALLQKGEVQRVPLDLNTVVKEVLRLMRDELTSRGVMASVELAPQLPWLLGDRIQLQQVLLNLVTNACDAMDGMGLRQLSVRTFAAAGGGVGVSIADSGRGIPAADLDRIFEPFVTSKEQGMGLGLSVCRKIVAAHGGRLWAESDGEGASLHFTLSPTGGLQ